MDIDLNVGLGLVDADDAESLDSYCTSEDYEAHTWLKEDGTSIKGEGTGSRQAGIKIESYDGNEAIGLSPTFVDINHAVGPKELPESGDPPSVHTNSSSQSSKEAHMIKNRGTFTQVDDIPIGHNCIKNCNGLSDEVDGSCISFFAREIEKKLEVGCSVVDVDSCYLLYCEYARLTGFSVRKGDQRCFGRGGTELVWKVFLCSSSGVYDPKRSKRAVATYNKMVTRTNCLAKLCIRIDVIGWKIESFFKDHNHPLVDIDQSYLMRSSRRMSLTNKALLEAMQTSGIPISQACGFLEKMSGGPQNTGFIRKDAYDHFQKKNRVTRLDDGDSSVLIEHLMKRSNRDPYFFWKVEKDDEGRLMNFFYRDSRCASDYKSFGDVLSLDTTFGTNRYKLSCAPFVGINHHMSNVMFGICFLSNETTRSFKWLLEAFLESMNGITPKLVFTDQCKALMNVVDSKFPNSQHRLCQWHINRNAIGKFGRLSSNAKFKALWRFCMNEAETEHDFEASWSDMMNSYKIPNRSWFDGMYAIRHRWACVFSRSIFTAGLHSTSRSENTNNVLKSCAKSSGSLYEFVCSYEDIQERWRATERAEDTHCLFLPGQYVSNNTTLMQAATVYTRAVYKIFQKQFAKLVNVVVDCDDSVCLGDENYMFKARRRGGNGTERTIIFNPSSMSATCSCAKLEQLGILCRHILSLFFMKNIESIPEKYILRRWTKKARIVVPPEVVTGSPSELLSSIEFASHMTRIVHELSLSGSMEARKDIEATIASLRDRISISDGGPKTKTPAKKKRKVDDGMSFHDPSPAKANGKAVKPRKEKEIKSNKGKRIDVRRSASQKATPLDIDLNID